MRILKSPEFARLARKHDVGDVALLKAVEEIENGKIDARLGKYLIKQRVARTGGGKSGGYRTVIVHVVGDRALFLFVFSKNEKANLNATELEEYRVLAKPLAEASIQVLLKSDWIEISDGRQP